MADNSEKYTWEWAPEIGLPRSGCSLFNNSMAGASFFPKCKSSAEDCLKCPARNETNRVSKITKVMGELEEDLTNFIKNEISKQHHEPPDNITLVTDNGTNHAIVEIEEKVFIDTYTIHMNFDKTGVSVAVTEIKER